MTINTKNTGLMRIGRIQMINGEFEIVYTTLPYQVESQRQIQMFTDTLGVELDEYYTELAKLSNGKVLTNGKLAVVFIWSALYAGSMLATRTCDFTYEDVLDWYEAADDADAAEWAKPIEMLAGAIKKKTASSTATIQTTQQTEVVSKPVMTVAEEATVTKLKNALK